MTQDSSRTGEIQMDIEMHDTFFPYWGMQEEKKQYCNVQQYIMSLEICKEVLGFFSSKNTYLLKYIRGINIPCKISHLKKKKSYSILVSPCLHILNVKILNLCIRRGIFVCVHMHIHHCVHVTAFTLVNELFV